MLSVPNNLLRQLVPKLDFQREQIFELYCTVQPHHSSYGIFGYLRRDGDANGLNFWLVFQVNLFPLRNTDIQHAMVCSFINSAEY